MALSIYTNVSSLNAQRSLNIANNTQGKAIERLSTGLRINSAADDASGLAISEQLRGQISGIKRATMNAQDGISYLQTAEGGMEEVTRILQRMRELSVQAGNGIYTTNDRAMLQLEVDQLKEEINRITLSTEFNTKKLLDGSATALWSSDKPFIGAIVKGPSVPEGDYLINTNIIQGTNSQYKTNIMSVKDGVLVAEITTPNSANATNVGAVSNPYNIPVTGNIDMSVTISTGVTARNQAAVDANALNFILTTGNTFKQAGSNWTISNAQMNWGVSPQFSGYYEVEFMGTGTLTGSMSYRYRMIDTKTNPPVPSNWVTATAQEGVGNTQVLKIAVDTKNFSAGTTFAAGEILPQGTLVPSGTVLTGSTTLPAGTVLGDGFTFSAGTSFAVGTVFDQDTVIDGVTYKARQALTAAVVVVAPFTLAGNVTMAGPHAVGTAGTNYTTAGTIKLGNTLTVAGAAGLAVPSGKSLTTYSEMSLRMPDVSKIHTGDKLLGSFETINAGGANWALSGGGTIKLGNGPTVDYSAIGSLTQEDNGDPLRNYNKVTLNLAKMDPKTGVVDYGNMSLQFDEQQRNAGSTLGTGVTKAGQFDVKIRDNGAAALDTKLSDISKFTNGEGVNILANTQELKIYGNGTYTSIFIESDDTVEDFMNKLSGAIIDNLDMGAKYPLTATTTVNDNLVNYVPNLHQVDGTNEAIPGTFIIQTAMLGQDSELVFVGQQGLIDALGISTIQNGQNSSMDVKVSDATTGKFIGSDNVNDGKLRGVIAGVEVTLEQNSGMDVVWNSGSKTLVYSQNTTQSTGYLHLVDNRTELQIGANQGQTMNISVGRLDTTGLEINDVYVTDMEQSQRAITKLDRAIFQVNAARATIGAQINRLEHTISNLGVAGENLTASDSRIRDVDIAAETSQFSLSQIRVQAATAMIAQANQIPQQALTLLKG